MFQHIRVSFTDYQWNDESTSDSPINIVQRAFYLYIYIYILKNICKYKNTYAYVYILYEHFINIRSMRKFADVIIYDVFTFQFQKYETWL